MRRLFILLALFIILVPLANCQLLPPLEDANQYVTLTPLTTAVPPTATPVPDGAAEVGQTFYKAWEAQNYLGMYSLLSPQSQALVDAASFSQRYTAAIRAATVQTIRTQPLTVAQEGSRATFTVQVAWETAVVGPINRTHTADLVYSDGRWGVVWHEGLILPELAGGNQLSLTYRAPSRANIYDINGKALAYQGNAIQFGVVPGQIQDEAGLLAILSALLGRTPESIQALYASAAPNWYVPIGQVPIQVMEANYAAVEPFIGKGLTVENKLTRIYSPIAPHVVGYIGRIPAEQADRYASLGYKEDAYVGLSGLEAWGEPYLGGTRGGILTVLSPTGEFVQTLVETEPRQARSIYTTFDIEFQQGVERILAEAGRIYGRPGAIVVLRPQTGEILAIASYPTYDPTVFDPSRADGPEAIAALNNNPTRPLFNRAAQGAYPPGSTFKIVTFAAAVTSGLYNPNSGYNSTGSWDRLGPQAIKYDWREGGHGFVSLRTALVVSCNSCFYDAGFNMDGVDPYHLPTVSRQFGLGSPTGVLGVAEAAGIIPDPAWKPANTAEGGWVAGDAVNMSIGQGYVLATPLQMAQIAAALANGGQLIEPTIVHRIGAGAGAPEEVLPARPSVPLPITNDVLALINQALRDVAQSDAGTATFVFDGFAVPVAGKTGTAETSQGRPNAWFIGYAPSQPYVKLDGNVVNEPELAIAVLMENAGEGSEVAAPIFKQVVALYYGLSNP